MFAFTRKDVDARVVGNALVVSFNGVELQKTWRADMAAVATATLELKENNKKFSVVMKKGDAEEEVATFGDKESAAYALGAITAAMLKGDTQAAGAARGGGGQAMGVVSKLFKAALVIFLILVLFNFLAPVLFPSSFVKTPTVSGTTSRPGTVPPGEPIPADQMFK